MKENVNRCRWVNLKNPLYRQYHDTEWGVPQHSDRMLFELLLLEGFQAGLSWECVLNKRARFRAVYDGFDPEAVSRYGEEKIQALLTDPGIIRNRRKIQASVANARAFLRIQKEFGSFDAYIWGFTEGKTLWESYDTRTASPLSDRISADLKKRGMKFVGSTVVYAYLQAIGVINGHGPECDWSAAGGEERAPAVSRYVVFDVETPNHLNRRMSAIGITVVENGRVAEEYYSLVNPETSFDGFNIRLTGIDEELVRDAPAFPALWEKIEPLMSSGVLAAHNPVFDMGVLKRCLQDYGIAWRSSAPYLCTVQMGRRLLPGMSHKLDALCGYYGIGLDHHHAGSDSRACAEILLRYIESGADPLSFIRTYFLEG